MFSFLFSFDLELLQFDSNLFSSLISHYFPIYIFGGFVWLYLNLIEHFVRSKNTPWLWHMLLPSRPGKLVLIFQVPFRHHCPPRTVSYLIHGTLLLPSQWHLRHWMSFIHFTSMCYLNVSSVQLRAVLVPSVFLSPSIHVPPRAEIKCGPWWPLTLPLTILLLASYASELMALCSLSSMPRKFPFQELLFFCQEQHTWESQRLLPLRSPIKCHQYFLSLTTLA